MAALRSAGRVRRAQRLFAYLAKRIADPAHLPDAFYLRVGVVFGGRLPAKGTLRTLFEEFDGT
jgi:hypothetical protein